MTERSAIEATYCDLKFVKGRKQCQIILEIPSERANEFVSIFGTPNPASETWVAIARLNSPIQQWEALTPKAQMYARCKEQNFQCFIGCVDEADARRKLEAEFSISHRFPLPEEKITAWRKLDNEYLEHIERDGA